MADVTAQPGPGTSCAQRVEFWKGSTCSVEHWDVLGAIPCLLEHPVLKGFSFGKAGISHGTSGCAGSHPMPPGASQAQGLSCAKASTGSGEHWDGAGSHPGPLHGAVLSAAHVELFPFLWFCIYGVSVCFIKALSDLEFLCSKFDFPTV